MSHLIKIYAVCKFSYFRLWYLKFLYKMFIKLRPDFTSKLVHVFGTPKFCIAPYDKIKHELVNLRSKCDVKSGLRNEMGRTILNRKTKMLYMQLSSPTGSVLFLQNPKVT